MKHVVLFSGGLSSAYTAYLVLQEHDKKDVVLLHTPTHSELPDADLFRDRVCRYLGVPKTEWGLGLDIWGVIEKNNAIPGQFLPFCTQQLKQKMKEEYYKYLKSIGEDFTEYVGFGVEEWKRVQKAVARAESAGRKIAFPIYDKKISKEEVKRIVTEEWGIELPAAYKYLDHNNCIPCFKAGKASWRVYWEHYHKEFVKAMEYEEKLGYTVFKDKSLRELEEIWKNDKEWMEKQCSLEDMIPCECWT